MKKLHLPVVILALLVQLTNMCCAATPIPDQPINRHTLMGDFVTIPFFHSQYLNQDREVIIWLPPGYDIHAKRRYPVLYMQDGQNLFDGATSFIQGHEWRADETATSLLADRKIEPIIMVGIYNAGSDRIDEYTPTAAHIQELGGGLYGGKADNYGKFMVTELKPYIDSHFMTKTDQADTGILGSSLGGLVSLYVALSYPNVYGKVGCISTSAWWDNNWICGMVSKLPQKTNQRIWQDVGTAEEPPSDPDPTALSGNRALRDSFLAKGWTLGKDYQYTEFAGAQHNEDSWAARFGQVLKFLYPASRLGR